ncbi:replication/maintenance protein RepL [Pseudomonas fulva]|uniref:replication/maintenance protein RepL n=1 Tax=Pseudomonas fulva TaxID=47880 RepID=UPI0031F7026D
MSYAIRIDGLLVDTESGEILGFDDKPSTHSNQYDYNPALYYRSVDDFDQYLKSHVDLRKLPPRKSRLRAAESDAYYAWKDSKGAIDCRITAPMMKVLKVLELAIKYRNILVTTQADLAKLLGVTPANVMTKLKPLVGRGLIRIRTSLDGVREGEVILTVNPNLIFRGDDPAQDWYCERWYEDAAANNLNSATQTNKQPLNAKMTVSDYTDEQRTLHQQGRYVEYGESVQAMRQAQQAETDVVRMPLAA